MLRGVSWPQQMTRSAIRRQDNEFSIPSHFERNLPGPFQVAERRLLAYVVNASGCTGVGGSQFDRGRHILNIATGGAPGGKGVGENQVATPILNTLHDWIEPVKRIAGTVDHGQAEYGSW